MFNWQWNAQRPLGMDQMEQRQGGLPGLMGGYMQPQSGMPQTGGQDPAYPMPQFNTGGALPPQHQFQPKDGWMTAGPIQQPQYPPKDGWMTHGPVTGGGMFNGGNLPTMQSSYGQGFGGMDWGRRMGGRTY